MNCLLNNLPEIDDEIQLCDPLAVIVVPTERTVEKIYNFISKLIKGTPIICTPLYHIESTFDKKRIIKVKLIAIVLNIQKLNTCMFNLF